MNLKHQLLKFYEQVFSATKDLTLGCLDIGCGELCEDSDHIPELIAHKVYEPISVRNGREVIDGMYWFLPYEHELIKQITGSSCIDWEVVTVAGLPTARTPDPTDQTKDDRCDKYKHFGGRCPIFESRPIACRSYPLRGFKNVQTGRLEMYTEMLCPFSKQLDEHYYATYVNIFAELARMDIPDAWWEHITATSGASSRVLVGTYDVNNMPTTIKAPNDITAEFPLQYPNWREALHAMRKRNNLHQIRRSRCRGSISSHELKAVV